MRLAHWKESADKPGSVVDSHSSGGRVTTPLERPTRKPCGPHVAAFAARFPIWSCSRWGLPCRRVLPPTRCALTAPFHPCRRPEGRVGGVLSVALSVGSRPPGVTWHRALGARTFLHTLIACSGCLADSGAHDRRFTRATQIRLAGRGGGAMRPARLVSGQADRRYCDSRRSGLLPGPPPARRSAARAARRARARLRTPEPAPQVERPRRR